MSRKTSIRFYIAAILLLGIGCALASCGKDNDSSDLEVENDSSDLEVERLKALLLDDQGQIAFDRTETSEGYLIGLFSLDDARSLATLYAGEGFKGQAYTHTLDGNKGSVQVSTGNNGIFYQVRFAVKGIPSFSLDLADGSEGGNSLGIHHTCPVCGMEWTSTFNRCPRAKDKKYHP